MLQALPNAVVAAVVKFEQELEIGFYHPGQRVFSPTASMIDNYSFLKVQVAVSIVPSETESLHWPP